MIALTLASSCGKGDAKASDGGSRADGGVVPDGGPVTGHPIALDQLCAAYTTALCTYFTQCQRLGFRDIDHCVGETDCRGVTTLISEVAAGAIGYDAAGAGACHARFLADPCHFAPFLFTPTIFEVLAECSGTLTPKRGTGEPCAENHECTSGLWCKKPLNGLVCPGACTAYRNVGDDCPSGTVCAPGTFCLGGTCRLPAKAGGACARASDCGPLISCGSNATCVDDNLWCDVFGTQTCQKGAGLGATCGTVSSNGTTTTVECDGALWCDAFFNQSGTCRARGGAGSACNTFGCTAGLHCEGDDAVGPEATLGTCQPPAAIGGVCRFTAECASNLACSNGACAARAGVNGHCSTDVDCQDGLFCTENFVCLTARYPGESCADPTSGCVHSLCRAGTCVHHAKAGQPCADNFDCASLACVSGTCEDHAVCAN